MRRLFLPNFDFEHVLSGRRSLPRRLHRLNEELASAWVAIASEGDLIHTPAPLEPGFFESLHAAGLPAVEPVLDPDSLAEPVEVSPWGWTAAIRDWADKRGHHFAAPPQDVVDRANSRRLSSSLEAQRGYAPPGAMLIQTETDLAAGLDRLSDPDSPWVLKAEFSMSARERLLGRGRTFSPPQAAWISKRLKANGVLFFEPWLERIEEVGLQFTIPPPGAGSPVLEGITPLLTDSAGRYRGNDFTPDANLENRWGEAVQIARRAAGHLQSLGYFGPLGIDAMRYRAPDGTIRVRSLQDINARYTMGRLSLGFRRLLRPGEHGQWRHGNWTDDWLAGREDSFVATRLVRTSPRIVGGQPTRYGTIIAFGCQPGVRPA